jgi:hypothetical protein
MNVKYKKQPKTKAVYSKPVREGVSPYEIYLLILTGACERA